MYELWNPKTIRELLSNNGFTFKKSLGQNFLINPNVCPQMAEYAVEDGTEGVIEIGTGVGILTTELAKVAKKVVAIELDERLKPVLDKTLSDFSNVKVVFADVCKIDLSELIEKEFKGKKVSICANLPYYITSPIIMMLLESKLPVNSITVMVQKEAADRICAEVGSRQAGAVTVAVNYYSSAETLFNVSRGSFLPSPNVDSTVIRLNIKPEPPIQVKSEKQFFKFVKSAFSQRRKTLVNSVSSTMGVSKDIMNSALETCGIDKSIRAEKLTLDELCNVANSIFDLTERGN